MPSSVMQTRKAPRKTLTVPGRYFTGKGSPVDVTLTDLSQGGCRFKAGDNKLIRGSHVQIFVIGSGPHYASVTWSGDGEVGVTFATALKPELVNQFENSHIPDYAAVPKDEAFDAMPDSAPRRFC